jgi:hypothetical protein
MAPLQQELSNLEVEPLQIVVHDPDREGFDTPAQESGLDRLTASRGDVEVDAIWTGTLPVNQCCCCCCPCCCA